VTTTNDSVEIAIIGAGIVGGAIAFALTQAGRQVTLIDRKGLAQEASFGNAGAFAFSISCRSPRPVSFKKRRAG
jgi:D-amino-acid dehydrogenase